VPIAGVTSSKGPANTLPAQTRLYLAIVGDILIIIVFDKFVIGYRPISCESR
jgi:hypothetical protein